MVDPREFGINTTELSRKLSSGLVLPSAQYRVNHALLSVEKRTFTKHELAYLVLVASEALLQKGAQA